jgi:alpha-N-arabinofuranosidase
MYKGFQEATYLPMDIRVDSIKVRGDKRSPERQVPVLSTSAAKQKDGSIIISLANIDLDKAQDIEIALNGTDAKAVSGRILTCKSITDYNTFEQPNNVAPKDFKDAKLKKGVLKVKVPAKSVVVLNVI